MRNKLLINLIFLLAIIILLNPNIAFASMADYTDEDAYKEYVEEKNEWNEIHKDSINKSSNNYLKSISIKNYEISPTFERQTINYSINKEIDSDTIMIDAEAEDEKASVSGTGIITLNSGENNLKINVTAENGTVRTYFIKVYRINSQTSEENILNQLSDDNKIENETENENNENINNNDTNKNNKNILVISFVIIIALAICIVIIKRKNK